MPASQPYQGRGGGLRKSPTEEKIVAAIHALGWKSATATYQPGKGWHIAYGNLLSASRELFVKNYDTFCAMLERGEV